MGPDKNSSPKRELGLCPKFATKDSHMNLPRSRSNNVPTNTRNKLQTIPKQKHESRGKGLSKRALCKVDGPRGRGGRSAETGRMVRNPRADSPLNATEPPETHPKTRTVRTLPADCPRATCAAQTVRDLQADGPPNSSWPETTDQTNRKESAQELVKNTKNTGTNYTPRTVRLLPVDSPPGTGTEAQA
jgi:hypothetical protein